MSVSPSSPKKLGEPIFRFEQIESTNTYARELAAQGADEGTAVVARQQTAGRGRQGRTWLSPPDAGLYLSLILKPPTAPTQAAFLTLAAAIAVAETLHLDYQVMADIKYPNDILVNERKICGILVESAIEGERLRHAVLGIGVNLGQRRFPAELQAIATSLFLESGLIVTPDEFLNPLLARLNQWYPIALYQTAEVINQWEALSSFARDCPVRIISEDGSLDGTTRGLASTGALRVELPGGEIREIISGEISVRKVTGNR